MIIGKVDLSDEDKKKFIASRKINYDREDDFKLQTIKTKVSDTRQLSSYSRRKQVKKLKENFSTKDREMTFDRFDHKCFKCEATEELCIDHHYPLRYGFPLSPSNAVVLCRSCNSSKKSKMPSKFYNEEELKELQTKLQIAN